MLSKIDSSGLERNYLLGSEARDLFRIIRTGHFPFEGIAILADLQQISCSDFTSGHTWYHMHSLERSTSRDSVALFLHAAIEAYASSSGKTSISTKSATLDDAMSSCLSTVAKKRFEPAQLPRRHFTCLYNKWYALNHKHSRRPVKLRWDPDSLHLDLMKSFTGERLDTVYSVKSGSYSTRMAFENRQACASITCGLL